MGDLHDLSAVEQGAAIAAGEVGRDEVVDHYLARIARLGAPDDDRLGAFVTVTEERARTAAASPLPHTAHGPLTGVPTAVKDLDPVAGVRTTFGSLVFSEFVPEVSDEVALRIDRAGMPVLGKTSTPELGSPCYTEPEGLAPAATPYDLTRMAGGSSGGAAVAVAAGLVPVAQGSDGGGSIRIPASCCGLVGLKPSRGVVSGAPMYGDPIGLATAGTLGRTVRDSAALLDVLAGRAVGDPTWTTVPSLLAACERPPERLRIARFVAPVIADVPVDPECVTAWEDASRLLAGLGHEVEDVEVPLPPDAVPVFEICWAVLTALTPVPADRRHLLRPLTRWLMERGEAVSAPDFGRAIGGLRRFAAGALTRLAPYDAVLTPTVAAPPLPVGAIRDDADPAADFEAQKRFTPWTSAWNVTGMPAASLPTHWTPDGLPVGVMLAGRPGEDALLVSLCAQVEAAAAGSGVAWADRHPPVWTE